MWCCGRFHPRRNSEARAATSMVIGANHQRTPHHVREPDQMAYSPQMPPHDHAQAGARATARVRRNLKNPPFDSNRVISADDAFLLMTQDLVGLPHRSTKADAGSAGTHPNVALSSGTNRSAR